MVVKVVAGMAVAAPGAMVITVVVVAAKGHYCFYLLLTPPLPLSFNYILIPIIIQYRCNYGKKKQILH